MVTSYIVVPFSIATRGKLKPGNPQNLRIALAPPASASCSQPSPRA
jgi:hypothetical protein